MSRLMRESLSSILRLSLWNSIVARQAAQARARKKLSKLKKTPAVTIDGTPVTLLANIEFPDDCKAALENGAVGIGLFRSEFLFMGRNRHTARIPGEEEQSRPYKKAVTLMKGRPVTIRTTISVRQNRSARRRRVH